jgi:hypothetical protein
MYKIFFGLITFIFIGSAALAQKPETYVSGQKQEKPSDGTGFKVRWVSVGGEYGESVNKLTNRESTSLSASFLVGFNNGVVLEARNRTQQTDNTSTTSTPNYGAPLSWQEVGLSRQYNVKITNLYARGLVGMHEVTNKRYSWYAQEIGLTDRIPGTSFGYILGYRWTDSFKAGMNGTNEQSRYTIYYNINKNHRISIRRTFQTGDTPTNMTHLGYSYRF